MSQHGDDLGSGRARELRLAFDRAFAEHPGEGRAQLVELLAIRAGGQALALRLDLLRGLFVDKVVTALPSPSPELLGLAGFRGDVVPVYDLGALLGAGVSGERLRYVVLVGHAGALVGLAFAGFDGHVRVSPGDLAVARAATSGPGGETRREIVRVGGEGDARVVVDVPALVGSLRARNG